MRGMEILEALDFIDGKYINEAKQTIISAKSKRKKNALKYRWQTKSGYLPWLPFWRW
jgi:hypothetical protein